MNTYLASHQSKDKSECTHTRIGSPEHHVFGGSYHIDNLPEFYAIYYQDVFVKGNSEHLTEKQLECGPLGIDLDFRYPEPKRQYTKDHIGDLVDVLVDLVNILPEPRKMLLGPSAPARFCEVLVELSIRSSTQIIRSSRISTRSHDT